MSHILKFAGRNGRKDEKVGVGVEANNGDVPFSLQSCPKRKTKGTPPPPPKSPFILLSWHFNFSLK